MTKKSEMIGPQQWQWVRTLQKNPEVVQEICNRYFRRYDADNGDALHVKDLPTAVQAVCSAMRIRSPSDQDMSHCLEKSLMFEDLIVKNSLLSSADFLRFFELVLRHVLHVVRPEASDPTPQDENESSAINSEVQQRAVDAAADESAPFCLNVCSVAGDGFEVEVTGAMRGWELMNMIGSQQASDTPGMYTAIVKDSIISLGRSLEEQGLADGDDVTVVFEPASAEDVKIVKYYHVLMSRISGTQQPLQASDLKVVSQLRDLNFEIEDSDRGRTALQFVREVGLPDGLQSITFGKKFDQRIDRITFPTGLQSLTFGFFFNSRVDDVALPSGLLSLTFGSHFNQRLDGLTLPSGLQSLTFGTSFNQDLDDVELPSGLKSLTFGNNFNHSLEDVDLPSGLEHLTFGMYFNQSMQEVALPSGLRTLTFGAFFKQSMDGVKLPAGLKSLNFGSYFQSSAFKKVAVPSGL
eukprot:TRINITY_DN10101_c0_g1_i1.p1 TRINITY_DN10101_c0_g1~~TRINITY_DN10101_c0_g1_i1.p1  ORF type:complete len:465 (+),score=101.22 TRINITY_DN10101_c0_g1_i1:192-1586(+)